jgi:ribosomal protein S18 acetylase RimI-like enzyme
MKSDIIIEPGIRPHHLNEAAEGYWQAFARKLAWPLGPQAKALEFLRASIDPSHAISAVSPDGRFLGVAGFKTKRGAFISGDFKALSTVYGSLGALWRGLLISLLERDFESGVLLMDGVFVAPQSRGMGVGSQLLDAIVGHAATEGLHEVRLDVIDTNPRARALYERKGFVATGEQKLGPLKPVFGFSSATTLIKQAETAEPV